MVLSMQGLSKINNKCVNECIENVSGRNKWYKENQTGVRR